MPMRASSALREIRPRRARPAPKGQSVVYFTLMVIAFILVVNAIVGERGLLTVLRAHREYADLEQAIARAKQENAQLSEKVRRLSEDPDAVEEVARRELGLIKPGEKLFIIQDVPPPDAATPPLPQRPATDRSAPR
jgi:cell division protein FtsB